MTIAEIYNHYITDMGVLNEASLSRLLSNVRHQDFAIVSASRYSNTKKKNIKLTRQLLAFLNQHRMGGFKLIGHWQEAPDGIDYKDATPDMLMSTVEESVFFAKPEDMDRKVFIQFCKLLCRQLNQDAVLIGLQDTRGQETSGIWIYFQDGTRKKLGNKITLMKTAQVYSYMKNKPDVPFVFEGFVQPINNVSKMAFKAKMLLY